MRQIVEEHIGYVTGHPSEKLYLHSPMLSFSSSWDRAFKFLERSEKKSLRLVECGFEDATNFLWELDVELPAPSEPGLYHLQYKSNPVNCIEIVERQLRQGLETKAHGGNPYPLMSALGNIVVMKHAAADQSQHLADLIDAVEFLRGDRLGADPSVLSNARKKAARDLEWLLYPADPMDDGSGPPNAHFMMNKHLSVAACYYVQS
jgi:hypothetical protein